jgi:hypothetical protein
MSSSASANSFAIVARFEGMTPSQIARYEMHRKRNGGDLGHVRSELSRDLPPLIGPDNWAELAMAEIAEMRVENFADEMETLERRGRKKEIMQRTVEGPRDP